MMREGGGTVQTYKGMKGGVIESGRCPWKEGAGGERREKEV